MRNDHTRGLQTDYEEATEFSIEAVYRDGPREVDQEPNQAIMWMTFVEQRLPRLCRVPHQDMPRFGYAML